MIFYLDFIDSHQSIKTTLDWLAFFVIAKTDF